MKTITYLISYTVAGELELFTTKVTTVEGRPLGPNEFLDCAIDDANRQKLFGEVKVTGVKEIKLKRQERAARIFFPGVNKNITVEIEYDTLENLLEEIYNFFVEIEYAPCVNPTFLLPYGFEEYEFDLGCALSCFFLRSASPEDNNMSLEEFETLTFKPVIHNEN